MPTPTNRLRLMKIDPGGDLNVWGQKLNENVFDLLDEAVGGVERVSLTGNNGTLTLSSSNYASDLSRNAALIFTGTPTVDVTVTIPAVEKVYLVSNTTGRNVTLTAGGVGVTLAANDRAPIWCDGTDCGFGAVTKQTVNGLIANAQLSPGVLPDQAGNAGKYLQTDGEVPIWSPVVIPAVPDFAGGAGATITTSTTLASSASVVQSVDMASNAQSVTLPDARTLSKGGRKFVILGVGNRTFGVRDNAGALLTVVPAGAAAELHLRDNSTAAGSWGVTGRGLEPALTLVDHTAPTTVTAAVEVAVRLTDTLSLHFGTNASGFSALAVDNGAGAAGTWTAVEAVGAATVLHSFRISDTQAIVFWTQSTNHKAAVLTVSGTTITVGTAASISGGTSTTAILAAVTFSGRPVLAQLTPTTYVVMFGGSQVRVMPIFVSGTTVTLGGSSLPDTLLSSGATALQLAVYRISDTQALAIYIDDVGTVGSPYSIRACVLTVLTTGIQNGTSAGINDVTVSVALPTCQLSATKYLVTYGTTSSVSSVAVTVSGNAVTFGTPLAVATGIPTVVYGDYTDLNANRFQPNLYAIDSSRALLTTSSTTSVSRHYVLSESGGVVTAGTPLFSLWSAATGGNFPQTPQGFLGFSYDRNGTGYPAENAVFSVTINGTALSVDGTFARPEFQPSSHSHRRFGLSGGVYGVFQDSSPYGATDYKTALTRNNVLHLFRFRPNAPPQYLGLVSLNNIAYGATMGLNEIAANKVSVIVDAGMTQPALSTQNVRLQIVEVAQ